MITLFIDTSTKNLIVALFKDDKLLESSCMSSSEHSKYAMSKMDEIFKNNNIDPKDVNKIMVINGPGSFTGLRIGVTIAKIYAWALNIKVIPISTLHAYALSYSGYDYYVPYIDARRKYVFGAIYDKDYNVVLKDSYISLEDLLNKSKSLSNVAYISDLGDALPNDLDVENIYKFYKDEEGISCHSLLPEYLKKTEAEEKFGGIDD